MVEKQAFWLNTKAFVSLFKKFKAFTKTWNFPHCSAAQTDQLSWNRRTKVQKYNQDILPVENILIEAAFAKFPNLS